MASTIDTNSWATLDSKSKSHVMDPWFSCSRRSWFSCSMWTRLPWPAPSWCIPRSTSHASRLLWSPVRCSTSRPESSHHGCLCEAAAAADAAGSAVAPTPMGLCEAAAAGSAAVTTTDWSLLVETTTGQLHRAPLQANRSPTYSRPCGAHASFPGGTSRAPSPLLMAGEEPPPSLRPAWVNPLLR